MIESDVSVTLQSFGVPELAYEFDPRTAAPGPAVACPTPTQYAQPPSNEWVAPTLSARRFQLSEVPADVLYKMCGDFTEEVFKRAGKSGYLRTTTTAPVQES